VTAHDEIIPNLVRIQGAGRQVDLHPTIATFLKEFVGKRTSGFLFCARQGKIDSTKSETLKRSLKGFRATFRFRRGPRPQVNREDYAILVTTAEFLRPAILKLLGELDSTTRTLREILTYLQKDHPEACKFLMRQPSAFSNSRTRLIFYTLRRNQRNKRNC
jgi:hypothetical protein